MAQRQLKWQTRNWKKMITLAFLTLGGLCLVGWLQSVPTRAAVTSEEVSMVVSDVVRLAQPTVHKAKPKFKLLKIYQFGGPLPSGVHRSSPGAIHAVSFHQPISLGTPGIVYGRISLSTGPQRMATVYLVVNSVSSVMYGRPVRP